MRACLSREGLKKTHFAKCERLEKAHWAFGGRPPTGQTDIRRAVGARRGGEKNLKFAGAAAIMSTI
jgi:hypothetical protein